MPLPEIPPPIQGVTAVIGAVSTAASYQAASGTAKSMTLEAWGPRVIPSWSNVFGGAAAPLVLVPDATGEGRAPADVIVNGRAEYNRHGREPVLAPGDVLWNPGSEVVFRKPAERVPKWTLARAPEAPREEALGLLERQASLAGHDLSTPDPRLLLGAARAWLLGCMRGEWHRGFLVSARWSPATTIVSSMSWHLWQLLSSPAGGALESFAGTPVDAADLEATLDVAARFPAPRLRELVFETNERVELRAVPEVSVRRVPLPWLTLEWQGDVAEQHLTVEGPTNRPLVRWRQLLAVHVNGRTPDDRCLWHDGLALELREGDVVTWPGGSLRVRS